MSRFIGADFQHSQGVDRTGILLVNLGTPAAPRAAAVRPYLREFLSDPRVVEVPRLLWFLILNGIIVPFRSRRSAAAYARVWTDAGSPLAVLSQQLTTGLTEHLADDATIVELAMTYGQPSISSAIDNLRGQGITRLLVLPLYPQYSATTTASVFDAVTKALHKHRWLPELRFINQYFQHSEWQDSIVSSIRAYQAEHGSAEKLLFSFHGIPQRYFKQGDPYYCQCHASARLIASQLHLEEGQWDVSFQSRLGREPWLQPYTDHTLKSLADKGIGHVQVVCPGFSVDCLETLDEIMVENEEWFIEAGGKRLDYIPALNDSPVHVQALNAILQKHLKNWPATMTQAGRVDPDRQRRAQIRADKDGYLL